MSGLSASHVIVLGIVVIIVVAILLTPVVLIIRAIRRGGSGSGPVHAELVRINDRLTSIEKVLKDIE